MALEINNDNFEKIVLQSELPVMLDVYTKWCGPCRAIAPWIEQLTTEYENRAFIGKMDAEECPDLTAKYEIRSVPTFLFFKNGILLINKVAQIKTQ